MPQPGMVGCASGWAPMGACFDTSSSLHSSSLNYIGAFTRPPHLQCGRKWLAIQSRFCAEHWQLKVENYLPELQSGYCWKYRKLLWKLIPWPFSHGLHNPSVLNVPHSKSGIVPRSSLSGAGQLGFWEVGKGGTIGWRVGQIGSVYKQPETEEDDSCHSWRVPSKWKGVQREVKGNSKGSKGSKGKLRGGVKGIAPCIYVNVMCMWENNWTLNDAIIVYI